MPRGVHKVKPAKPVKASESSFISRVTGNVPSMATQTSWKVGRRTSTFLSRNASEPKLADLTTDPPSAVQEFPCQQTETETVEIQTTQNTPILVVQSTESDPKSGNTLDETAPEEIDPLSRPTSSRTTSAQSLSEEVIYEADLDSFEELTIEETQSSASSLYFRDSTSIYSKDSASIYSSASSIYSNRDSASIYSSSASVYSFEENKSEFSVDARFPGGAQYNQRRTSVAIKRQEIQDAQAREASSLAKKAAMFKNSRLSPQLPSFNTSLPAWSMVCRAAQASLDCYDSQALTRRGTYTPADTTKDIKAMIVDDQLIDDTRLVIVSVRGTQFKCLADWSVNKAANPVKPTGFLDDEDNACHAGFLQVTKAMVAQVATQLQQHPASSERPSLLFTGHSAGGAIAAMLYSHILSTSVQSDLTALASQFSSINCITFGAPPLSLTPLPRREHGSGVFLSFANEGDPVLRLSNAAYVKSLAKLMTASPPASVAVAPVKVVRRSRGTAVIRKIEAPTIPWEELPLWPSPLAPLTNAGDVILLRDQESGNATASRVTSEELREVIFGDLAQHTIEMYIRRVKQVALDAMMGIQL